MFLASYGSNEGRYTHLSEPYRRTTDRGNTSSLETTRQEP